MFVLFVDVEGSIFSHPIEAVLAMFMMSLGEFGDFYESFDETPYKSLAIVGYGCCYYLIVNTFTLSAHVHL